MQQLGIDVAGIDDMLLGQKAFLLESFMNGCGSCIIGDGCRRRFHMGDQMRAVFLTRFGEMDLEAYPTGRALLTVMGIQIVGELIYKAAGGIFSAQRQLSLPSLH